MIWNAENQDEIKRKIKGNLKMMVLGVKLGEAGRETNFLITSVENRL